MIPLQQGPCSSNQTALAHTNFLASCNRVFGYIEFVTDPVLLTDESREVEKLKCNIMTGLLGVLQR